MYSLELVAVLFLVVLTHDCIGRSKDNSKKVDLSPPSKLALQCPKCDKIYCHPRRASKLRCKGGKTTGVCNCCPVCAKVEGEVCGGEWEYLGKCDQGLHCEPRKIQPYSIYPSSDYGLASGRTYPAEGKCKKRAAQRDGFGEPDKLAGCSPSCTPDYCRKNPKAICSAHDTAEEQQKCQGKCQHTSCSACRFISEPDCAKCGKDDFQCMRQFAKCIKKQICSRQKFPCKKSKIDENGKFTCAVPKCLD